MQRTLEQAVEDWFRNSPAWPLKPWQINIGGEAEAFVLDGCEWPIQAVRRQMAKFVTELAAGLDPLPEPGSST